MSETIFPDRLGRRLLFGAYPHEDGVSFSLFSRSAHQVHLMLFSAADDIHPVLEVAMQRFGDVWHLDCPEARPGMFYCFRAEQENGENAEQWLLDPYARAIYWSTPWGEPTMDQPGIFPQYGNAFPKSIIVNSHFDWGCNRKSDIAWEDMVIYEVHVRGFTRDTSSGVHFPGTYDGFIEKLPYLKSLGVTSVELLPVFEFNEREYFYHKGDTRRDLHNYWGYSTIGFFAPNGRYAADGRAGEQVDEFKRLVKAIHDQGMEVILDVVFNHTAENGSDDFTYSFRGIDEHIYYSITEHGAYRNFTGCGNTVNCNHPSVRDFIINSLRYWVSEYHIDGFRFDLASIFCRGQFGRLLKQPPLIEKIDDDPILRGVKLIAEAWDCSTYLVGEWPSKSWSEWNGKYRDDIRRFWKGDDEMLSLFATRITGSADLYHKDDWVQKSINFITCHDGMTLNDLVSYNEKHNLANLENNGDGTNENFSCNHGHEGPTENKLICAIRLQQQKNFIATLFLSQGIPMLLGGDEFSRTQEGNNNPYCQDNAISWFDWNLLEENQELYRFTQECIKLRKRFGNLRRTRFFVDADPAIRWWGLNGAEVVWDKDKAIACWLSGKPEHTGHSENCGDLFMMFNPDTEHAQFHLPRSNVNAWNLLLNSAEIESNDAFVTLPPHSLAVYTNEPQI